MKLQTSTANEDIFSFYQPAGNFFALSINNSSDGEHPDVRLTLFDSAGKQLTPTPVKMPESVGWTFNDYLVSGNKIYGLIRGDGAIGYIVAIDVTNPVKPQYSGLADMYQAFADDSVFDAVLMNGYIYLYSTGTVNDKYFDLLRKIKADAFAGPDIVRVSQAVLPEFAEGSWVVAMLTGNNVLYVVTSSNGILVYKP